MVALPDNLLSFIVDKNLDFFQGQFGLEKENVRVDGEGRLALTPHPPAFGSKSDNPYIQTDFSESQIEMITPVFPSIDGAYRFLEALHDLVSVELEERGEFLWPSSNPPILPDEREIPVAHLENPAEEAYRNRLADKYGRKRQLLSGIHFNFSFPEELLRALHEGIRPQESYPAFKNALYLKMARNLLRYRWLLIYLTGASPVFDKTYIERCVALGSTHDQLSYSFPHMNSLRNSPCGYRNPDPLAVSFQTLEEHIADLNRLIQSGTLLSAKEFYSPVRLKPAQGGTETDPLRLLGRNGIEYLEIRLLDLNPLDKIGIRKETMRLVHLFLLWSLVKEDEPYEFEDQMMAQLNQDQLLEVGIEGYLYDRESRRIEMKERAGQVLDRLLELAEALASQDQTWVALLEGERMKLLHPECSYASRVKAEIACSSFMRYHLAKAKEYAGQSRQSGYRFGGYEDLELSTQLLLKAAVKRGIAFELLDRTENFVVLTKGDRQEFVKQATKTSLDSYSTVLIMENKLVTKEVLKRNGIRVPHGTAFHNREEALAAYPAYRDKPSVIKPKSTNFGLGITIFDRGCSEEDYARAVEMAFAHDRTVLLEEFILGKEYRFLVMGDEVVGILHRVPANVVGDGVSTIEQLVREKNRDPLRGKGYKTPLEQLQLGEAETMFLKQHGWNRAAVPTAGTAVYLRENSNISTGGDSIDMTDEIPDSYNRLAIRSAQAAGAAICGVDMMITDTGEEATETNYGIIEINFNPAIHIHSYPYRGKNRKPAEKILDLLFGPLALPMPSPLASATR
ncbi:bifunctional glutamate--cysteine ligase GshA/glutathione synthetase GshB [Gorillibacterium sp. sgz500922]|uniref:bifunctional glutamate--cysteine ligase GshA/glutathione synthetase GshB n=1 Tax=Gorillibacterium sp. sgz500922 TaxID=3446694 RepID=UPI003F66A9D1